MTDHFQSYLLHLGFSEEELRVGLKDGVFKHSVAGSPLSVSYIHTPSELDLFKAHQFQWNANDDFVFIAVGEKKSHLINAKEKPDEKKPLKKTICIKSFEYGVNSRGFEGVEKELISKTNVNSGYFFDFISKCRKSKKDTAVDKDLLLNLLHLKNDLNQDGNQDVVHVLILRCLFIKYLEDRGIFDENYLLTILESGEPNRLIEAFDKVARINGDVFKYDDQFKAADIKTSYLSPLALFFKSDYRSGQHRLFPYKFDQIPIQLISHVYEAFLKESVKKGDGIYYTPTFLVNFMLAHSFEEKLRGNPKATIFDPAVGSGAFLVQAFKLIVAAHSGKLDFDAKKQILQRQLFGTDIDRKALQISAFSLYLALLETEDPEFIRDEIERANPILPSLIGTTLIAGNSILENVFPDMVFDCVASNPPWGSIPKESKDETLQAIYQSERKAIEDASLFPEYQYVADFERSQAFLTRVAKWGDEKTLFVMVVKNSIFLNDEALEFRKDLLTRYQIQTFYELSHYNSILFKKTSIGEVGGEKIELGASEPCAVLVFKLSAIQKNTLTYISPKLTQFGKHFEIIHSTNADRFELKQSDLVAKDSLWKVLVNGDLEGFDLIEKLSSFKDEPILNCGKGLEPQKNEVIPLDSNHVEFVKSADFVRFRLTKNPAKFNLNQELRRPGNPALFNGKRILIANRPIPSDRFRLRAMFIEREAYFRNDLFGIGFKDSENTLFYLGCINSSLFGYYIFNLSAQWFGGHKRDYIRKSELTKLPFISADRVSQVKPLIIDQVSSIISDAINTPILEAELDKLILDLYGLLDYEKEIIKEFYDIRVNRAGVRESKLRPADIKAYSDAFSDAFSLILSNKTSLQVSYNISPNLGAIICFSIINEEGLTSIQQDSKLEILSLVKSRQMDSSDSMKILFEEKVKIYEKEKFYIVKSNQFKDWTVRQAIKDAKEEIEAVINQLPSGK